MLPRNMDRKKKLFLLMVFKVLLKNKWKRRKLKFNTYYMTSKEVAL